MKKISAAAALLIFYAQLTTSERVMFIPLNAVDLKLIIMIYAGNGSR
jgi:hypothetical protein